MTYMSRFQSTQPNALLPLNNAAPRPAPPPQLVNQWSTVRGAMGNMRSAAWELALKFGQSTTIHGMNRLLRRSAGRYERSVWLLTVLLAFLGTIYVCHLLSERFSESKLETVVDSTRMPVYRIVFPVVSICNLNMLNWERIDEAKRQFLTNNVSIESERLFERILYAYDALDFMNFDEFAVLENDPLAQLNHVNFSAVANFMTWRCEEFLTQCFWNRFPMNCCEIFSKRRSKNGLCWSFNTLETEEGRRMKKLDPMWPWHTGAAGPGSGLQVKVLMNPEKHAPNRTNEKGINVMITEPNVWHKDPVLIPSNTQATIEVEPVIYFYDNNTRSLSSKARQCVFFDEQNSVDFKTLANYPYMIENCQSECHQEYLLRYCNCTMDLLFPPSSYKPCRAADLPCLAKNNHIFRYSHRPDELMYVHYRYQGMQCECFRNCYSLNYLADARPSFLSPEIRGNLSYVDLDVHYRFETMMVYRTSLIFGWVDLMVAFGGIAGLFLGCSLISTMELAYFLFVDVPTFIMKRVRKKRQAEASQKSFLLSNAQLVQEWQSKQKNVSQQKFEHLLIHGVKERNALNAEKNWHATVKKGNQY